jgi:hypothetical protein
MNINQIKEILIDAHVQLCSFEKSMEKIGVKEQYFDLEFEWIQTCIGLCEIYQNCSDDFARTRALEKINLLLGFEDQSSQLSFKFAPSDQNPKRKSNTEESFKSDLNFENASFSDDQ